MFHESELRRAGICIDIFEVCGLHIGLEGTLCPLVSGSELGGPGINFRSSSSIWINRV